MPRFGIKEGASIAIYHALARDAHVPLLDRKDEVLCAPALPYAAPVLRIGVRFVVVGKIRTAKQSGTFFQIQFGIVAQIDGTYQIRTGRNHHLAAGLRAFVKRALHRHRILCLSIALRAERADVISTRRMARPYLKADSYGSNYPIRY